MVQDGNGNSKMSIFLLLLLLLASQKNQEFRVLNDVYKNLVVIRNIEDVESSLRFLVNFKKNNKTKGDKLVDAVISDLELISKAHQETKNQILKLINDLFIETRKEANNLEGDFFEPIEKKIEMLESLLGKNSFYVIYYKMSLLVYKSATGKDLISYKEIDQAKEQIIEKFGKNSPITAEAYIACCIHNDRSKNWRALKKNAKNALEIKTNNGIDGYGLTSSVSYLVKSSIMLGQYKEAIKYREIINASVLESINIGTIKSQLRIYSSLATAYSNLGKIIDAIAMQEMAVAAACEIFNSGSPQAKEQALVLRDLLAKNREFISMRNLENRFKLQPLPLQNGEK